MFIHVFKARLKCILRDRMLVFWTLFFPVILATFFNFAFSKLYTNDIFKDIPIAVVDNKAYQADVTFKSILENAESGSSKLFSITVVSQEKAADLLENNKIKGYLVVEDKVKLIVKSTGMEQTILKTFLDQYAQTANTFKTILEKNPGISYEALGRDIGNRIDYLTDVPVQGNKKPNDTLIFFYSLMGLACMYGSFLGLKEITDIQPNISKSGARLSLAPVHKLKLFLGGLVAAFLVSIAEISILLGYLILILRVDFGSQIGYVLLTCLFGSSIGITLGAVIGALSKKSESFKRSILIAVTLGGSFLSGMMASPIIKYLVTKNVPVLSYLNPISLLTDAFYSLYYYESHSRFFLNITLLGAFTVLLYFIIYLALRRQKYDSI